MSTFHSNSTVCFLGDSITADGHWIRRIYSHYRQEGIPCKLFNCGVPGDAADRAYWRLEETVFCHQPSEVVIALGMNDIDCLLYRDEPLTEAGVMTRRRMLDNSIAYLRAIADQCIARGIRVTFCTPTLIDELTENDTPPYPGAAAALLELSLRIRALGKELGAPVIDFSRPFRDMGLQLYKEGKTMINDDRIHPILEGHEYMARLFLKAQGFDVTVPATWEELETLAAVPYDQWEEKRYQLEQAAGTNLFVEWYFGFGKKSRETMEIIVADLLKTEERPFVRQKLEDYWDNYDKIPQYRQALIDHTNTIAL